MIDRLLHSLRIVNRPLQRLHASDRAAQHQPKTPDTQRIQQLGLRSHVVADGDQWKIGTVDQAGLRIHRPRPGRPVTRPEHIYADDEVLLQRQTPRRERKSPATTSPPVPSPISA